MNAGGRWFSSINKYGNCSMKKNFWSVFTLMNKRINWKLYVSLAQHISVDRGGLGTEVTHGNGSYQKLKDIYRIETLNSIEYVSQIMRTLDSRTLHHTSNNVNVMRAVRTSSKARDMCTRQAGTP